MMIDPVVTPCGALAGSTVTFSLLWYPFCVRSGSLLRTTSISAPTVTPASSVRAESSCGCRTRIQGCVVRTRNGAIPEPILETVTMSPASGLSGSTLTTMTPGPFTMSLGSPISAAAPAGSTGGVWSVWGEMLQSGMSVGKSILGQPPANESCSHASNTAGANADAMRG